VLFHQVLRGVAEPDESVHEAVTAVRVFSWLFQIENGCDSFPERLRSLLFELTDDVEFSDESVGQALRRNNIFVNPVGVKALNSDIIAQLPILMFTGRSAAEVTEKLCRIAELPW